MPIYTLLGATGSTGTAIVRNLLNNPPQDLKLNISVRSKSNSSPSSRTSNKPQLSRPTSLKAYPPTPKLSANVSTA